jgi:RNA polymerase sigma-70 factor (ECF subfamily)
MSSPEDRELIDLTLGGDHRAFAVLLKAHDDQMRAVASRMLVSQAAMDDALQDAYLKAYRSLAGFRGEAPFGAWLQRVVTRTCIDYLRRQGRRGEVGLDAVLSTQQAGRAFDDNYVDRSALGTALASLPVHHRAVVLLVDGEGYDYDEAAELLNTSRGTVASRLSRARATLRAMLEAGRQERCR